MNLKHLKDILNTYEDSELEEMKMWINCSDEVSYILIDEYFINLITRNAEIKIDGFIEQEGKNNGNQNNK